MKCSNILRSIFKHQYHALNSFIGIYCLSGLTGLDHAAHEVRIAFVASLAGADRLMVYDPTVGVDAAHALARVDALLARTGLVQTALGVRDALGSAALRGITEVAGHTGADGCSLAFRALGIGSAWRRDTGVSRRVRWRCRP